MVQDKSCLSFTFLRLCKMEIPLGLYHQPTISCSQSQRRTLTVWGLLQARALRLSKVVCFLSAQPCRPAGDKTQERQHGKACHPLPPPALSPTFPGRVGKGRTPCQRTPKSLLSICGCSDAGAWQRGHKRAVRPMPSQGALGCRDGLC